MHLQSLAAAMSLRAVA